MRALVVDDSKPVRSILGKMLRELNFEVSEASNGKEGLALLDELESVDLVTVNWNMPVMDGLAFVRQVRSTSRYRKLPMVMVTSEGGPLKKAEALKAGVSDYIIKPFSKQVLATTLQNLGFADTAADSPLSKQESTGELKLPEKSKPIRVLIVDDSVIIRRTVSKVLEEDPDVVRLGVLADVLLSHSSLPPAARAPPV